MPLIIIGIICLILAALLAAPVLWTVGIICIVVGIILILLSYMGGATAAGGPRGGRWGRWW